MCYKCAICSAVSERGMPLIKHTVYRADRQIEREFPVCAEHKSRLNAGECPRKMALEAQKEMDRERDRQREAAIRQPKSADTSLAGAIKDGTVKPQRVSGTPKVARKPTTLPADDMPDVDLLALRGALRKQVSGKQVK